MKGRAEDFERKTRGRGITQVGRNRAFFTIWRKRIRT
jgi:hypothetical protein